MTDPVPRLEPAQLQFLTLDQIRKALQDAAKITVAQSTSGEIYADSQYFTDKGPVREQGKDIFPRNKAWRSVNIFNNSPPIIDVELKTRYINFNPKTKRQEEQVDWQDIIKVKKGFLLRAEFKEDRILGLRIKAETGSASVDFTLAR